MPHVLLIDDDDAVRYSMAKALEAVGFAVTTARDYRDALPVVHGDGPLDLLITDIVMPRRVNGFALARMGLMRRPALKVIYVTAFDDVPTSEAAGPVLRKPVTGEALVAAARRALTPD